MKISFTSIPFLDDSEEGSDRESGYEEEEDEYIFDALGRRVPAGTKKSGTAVPLKIKKTED